MALDLADRRISILATDGVERVELEQPRGALYGAGASSDLLSIHSGEIQAPAVRPGLGRNVLGGPPGRRRIGRALRRAPATGRHRQPGRAEDRSRRGAFVRAFVATGKPVAAICHGPWTLIEVDVVRGHRFTSWPSLWTDLRNAGAEAVDEQVVIDGQFTTSRSPADLPAFCPSIVGQFAGARVPT
jgi:protease I